MTIFPLLRDNSTTCNRDAAANGGCKERDLTFLHSEGRAAAVCGMIKNPVLSKGRAGWN